METLSEKKGEGAGFAMSKILIYLPLLVSVLVSYGVAVLFTHPKTILWSFPTTYFLLSDVLSRSRSSVTSRIVAFVVDFVLWTIPWLVFLAPSDLWIGIGVMPSVLCFVGLRIILVSLLEEREKMTSRKRVGAVAASTILAFVGIINLWSLWSFYLSHQSLTFWSLWAF